MSEEVLLVAEQDENGRLTAVWCKMPHDRVARPINRIDLQAINSMKPIYHGASATEFTAYFDERFSSQ